jgi:hypothetical protein
VRSRPHGRARPCTVRSCRRRGKPPISDSSTLIFSLLLLALCGICWQAGFRLAFNRPDRSGTLFSRPAWFAIGSGLVVVAAMMAFAIFSVRQPTGIDYWVIVTLGALGVWCIILAFRRGATPIESH